MNEVIGFAAVIVSIFAGILFNNSRLNQIEEKMESRFSEISSRFGEVNSHFGEISSRFGEVNSHFGEISTRFSEMNIRLDRMQADLIVFYRDLGRHEAQLEALEKRIS